MNKMKYVFLGLAFMGASMVEAATAYVEIPAGVPANLSLVSASLDGLSWPDPAAAAPAAMALVPGTVIKLDVPNNAAQREVEFRMSIPRAQLGASYQGVDGDLTTNIRLRIPAGANGDELFFTLSQMGGHPIFLLASRAPLSAAEMAAAVVLNLA